VIAQDFVLKRTTKHKHDTATGTRCQTNNPISNKVQIKLIQIKPRNQEKEIIHIPIEYLKATSRSDRSTFAPSQDESATADKARTKAYIDA
jgi:hypothetical protein